MTAIIETKNLSKAYGSVPAVKDVTFSVEPGEVVGFVGLNGAGKSTTINMLMGFQAPSLGEVRLFGDVVTLANAHKSHKRVGFATGDMSLFDGMTGLHYLRFVASTHKTTLETAMYQQLVATFKPQLHKKLKTLSRGNKQKIALIAAFMSEPELVILDEPSAGLDPLMQQHFLALVREQAQKGVTIFMSSHYLGEVADVCTRILLIKDGALLKDIPASALQMSTGKFVRVVTGQKVSPPKSAENIVQSNTDNVHTLEFVYADKSLRLQEWIGTLPKLQDLTVSDHNPEGAFQDLYEERGAQDA